MKNFIVLIALTLICNKITAQQFGDKADTVKQLIEWNYIQKERYDLKKYGELQYTYEVKYDSLNRIEEITVNQKNVIYHDLEAKSSTLISYLFNLDEEFTSTVTTYINLTEEHVRAKFNKLYGHRNHGYDYYFTYDYQNVRYIYSENDKAVVVYKKFTPSAYESSEFHQLIKRKQEEFRQKQD